ncbi:hypothetical protein Pcinc_003296 [Petrolisthes cinctipes]|uniref:F5/8 type C domain-containing protein n=1 Tax=Petrolisthes cinctipes TaxID=88211 RepID=A0AAE1L258_PETCI|nr:hypothetical protein Pcinc_003296 [Petrolisthes cinctipes]
MILFVTFMFMDMGSSLPLWERKTVEMKCRVESGVALQLVTLVVLKALLPHPAATTYANFQYTQVSPSFPSSLGSCLLLSKEMGEASVIRCGAMCLATPSCRLFCIKVSFVMETAAVNVNIRYDSVSLHELRPSVHDPIPSHLIDSVNLLQELQVSSDVRKDVPGRRQRKRARGRRSGVRVRMRRRGIRTPLPALTFGNVRSLRNKIDELSANCTQCELFRATVTSGWDGEGDGAAYEFSRCWSLHPKNNDLAHDAPTASKSVYLSYTHSNPVSLNYSCDDSNACYESMHDDTPWWRVDLGTPKIVSEVRIHGFALLDPVVEFRLGNDTTAANNPLFVTSFTPTSFGEIFLKPPTSVTGQYFFVTENQASDIRVCDVWILGTPTAENW